MPKGLAIVIGAAKPKGDAAPSESEGSSLAADYAREALDAIKDDDAEAFAAAIRGLSRCSDEEDADDHDSED